MNQTEFQLPNAPIIEAVLDIDCDLPPSLELEMLKAAATDALQGRYPKFRQQLIHQHVFRKEAGAEPEIQMKESLGPMQFLTQDEKQLVQFRPNGFSFNRLAPYSSLDDYLPEIEASWNTFRELARPLLVRKIGIRMINRILLPMPEGRLDFGDFLLVPPRLPETGDKLGFIGFLDQHLAADVETGNQANIVKTTELPQDGKLPLILDIDVFHPGQLGQESWEDLLARIKSLRNLKNRIFRHTLTPQCLNLFSH